MSVNTNAVGTLRCLPDLQYNATFRDTDPMTPASMLSAFSHQARTIFLLHLPTQRRKFLWFTLRDVI